jgi:putative SOS response-associated peptidase YedK
MCNLYSMTSNQAAIRQLSMFLGDITGNLATYPGIYPDYPAPIVRNHDGNRQLAMARWGMPSPAVALKDKDGETKKTDPGVTNVRNLKSSHWRRWLGVANRCVVPFTSFAENEALPDGRKPPVWFALEESRPLAFFAGIWTTWTGIRKVREGIMTIDLFALLTTTPNAEVAAIHPKAMPVILLTRDEIDHWLTAPAAAAMEMQRPLPDGRLTIVARGGKSDGA